MRLLRGVGCRALASLLSGIRNCRSRPLWLVLHAARLSAEGEALAGCALAEPWLAAGHWVQKLPFGPCLWASRLVVFRRVCSPCHPSLCSRGQLRPSAGLCRSDPLSFCSLGLQTESALAGLVRCEALAAGCGWSTVQKLLFGSFSAAAALGCRGERPW